MNIYSKADPERYEQMSRPHASAEEAETVAKELIEAVGELREKFRIPELILHFELNVQMPEDVQVLSGGCGWGDQLKQAKLARKMADREFQHLADLIEPLAAAVPEIWRALLTDPSATLSRQGDKTSTTHE